MAGGLGRVVSLDDAVDVLDPPAHRVTATSRRRRSGTRYDPVVVTFDDGTADLADVATPMLERHGVPATVYLATRFVDEGEAFPDDGTPLSWSAVRDMASTGLITFGSHTHGHRLLDRLPPAEAADELDRSRDLIEDRVGRARRPLRLPQGRGCLARGRTPRP